MSSRRLTRSIAAGAAAIAIAGGSYGIVSATSSSSAAASPANPAKVGSNARSGPASGGASGTVGSVSKSSFTMSASAGQKVTVDEASSTTYQKETTPASASAVTPGEPVLVLVKLSNGEYEVHYIGVKWPHHVFVNQDFKVVGAE
jgi:hypothetical protein